MAANTVYVIDEYSAQRIQRLERLVNSISGPYVKNDGQTITIGPPPAGRERPNFGGDEEVTFQIDSEATAPGAYNIKTYVGPTESDLGELSSTINGTAINLPEQVLAPAAKLLKSGQVYTGVVRGNAANGILIHFNALPVGKTASPTTLGGNTEGSEAADTGAWTRSSTSTPLVLWITGRVGYFESGDEKLYAYVRSLTFDACGILVSVSAETRVEVDVPDSCP